MMNGQVGIEFITFMVLLLIILSALLYSTSSREQELIAIRSDMDVKDLCEDIAFEINEAVRAGDGYKRRFYVKESLIGIKDFNITVSDYSVFINWNGKSRSCYIITSNFTGNVTKGWNIINNTKGAIYVY